MDTTDCCSWRTTHYHSPPSTHYAGAQCPIPPHDHSTWDTHTGTCQTHWVPSSHGPPFLLGHPHTADMGPFHPAVGRAQCDDCGSIPPAPTYRGLLPTTRVTCTTTHLPPTARTPLHRFICTFYSGFPFSPFRLPSRSTFIPTCLPSAWIPTLVPHFTTTPSYTCGFAILLHFTLPRFHGCVSSHYVVCVVLWFAAHTHAHLHTTHRTWVYAVCHFTHGLLDHAFYVTPTTCATGDIAPIFFTDAPFTPHPPRYLPVYSPLIRLPHTYYAVCTLPHDVTYGDF